MAARDPNQLNNSAAESLVFDNLGLTQDDLGVGDEGSDDLDLDEGEGGDDQLDDLSVSHTEQDRQQQQRGPDQRQQQQKQQPPRQDQQRQQQFRPQAEVKPDGKGNLVNTQTGQIVARAGAEARLYQNAHTARQQADGYRRQVEETEGRLKRAIELGQQMHNELTKYQGRDQQLQAIGVKPEHFLSALELWKNIQTSPAETIKKLLTQAAANGINIAELGTPGGGQPFDLQALMSTIKDEINRNMHPLNERSRAEAAERQQQQEQERIQNEANATTSKFFNENPEAREYIPVFQELMKHPQHSQMTLGEMWARIQLNLLRNPPRNGNGQERNRQNRRNSSLPSGRGSPQSGNSEMADIGTSYDQIIKDVLNEGGIKQ